MKRVVLSLLFALESVALLHAQESQVAVFVYCDKTVSTPVSALISKLTSSLLFGDYTVIDRSDEILDVLKTVYEYQAGGAVRDDQLISVGNQLNVNYICAVNVVYYEEYSEYFFDCKLVNVATRRIEKQALYPDKNKGQTKVTTFSPQDQINVAQALATEFGKLASSILDLSLSIGDYCYGGDANIPMEIQGIKPRIGWLNSTGKHGIVFVVLPNKTAGPKAHSGFITPSLEQLRLLYKEREVLGLYEAYWTSVVYSFPIAGGLGVKYDSSAHKVKDFSTGEEFFWENSSLASSLIIKYF